MKKFGLMPYFDLLVLLYYLTIVGVIITFFFYVTISDQVYDEIEATEYELRYCQDAHDEATEAIVTEKLNTLKEQENIYMRCKLKYLAISALMILIVYADAKIFTKFKDKDCWYTNIHKNCLYLYGSSLE